MSEALRAVGHAAIRNRGTVAGSVAHADPASELPALLLCLDGAAVARGAAGERVIPAGELFRAPLTTSLRPDELVTRGAVLAAAARRGLGLRRGGAPPRRLRPRRRRRARSGWTAAGAWPARGSRCSAWAARRSGAARRRRCSPVRRRAPSASARPRAPPPRSCARMAISTPPRAIGSEVAAVLAERTLDRGARAAAGGRHDARGAAHRQRADAGGRRRAPALARRFSPRGPRPHRHPRGLRARRLRRVHRAARRGAHPRLPDARGPGGGAQHHDRRGPRARETGSARSSRHSRTSMGSSAATARRASCSPPRPSSRENPSPTRDEIREMLAGNLCRCTGYHLIVEAIEAAAPRAADRPARTHAPKPA